MTAGRLATPAGGRWTEESALRVAGVTLSEFNPRLPWVGGDLQTIRNYALSVDHALPSHAVQRLELPLQDGSGDRLVAALHLPGETRDPPLVLLIHGISGSETSCYIVLAAAFFLARGYPVLRINQRGAGPSRRLCRQQYHAGRTDDLAALIDRLDPADPQRRAADRLLARRQPAAQVSRRGRRQRPGAPRRHGLRADRPRAQLPLADALAHRFNRPYCICCP